MSTSKNSLEFSEITLKHLENCQTLKLIQPIIKFDEDYSVESVPKSLCHYILPPLLKDCMDEDMYDEYVDTIGHQLPFESEVNHVKLSFHESISPKPLPITSSKVIFNVDPIEQHGPHLTLGTDIHISNSIINKIIYDGINIQKVNGVNIGCMRWGTTIGGSVAVSESFLTKYLIKYLTGLADRGVEEAHLVSTHLALNHRKVLEQVKSLTQNLIDVKLHFPLLSIKETQEDCHAGYVETAISHALGLKINFDHINEELLEKSLSTSSMFSLSDLNYLDFKRHLNNLEWNGLVASKRLFNMDEHRMKSDGEIYFNQMFKSIEAKLKDYV